jgi:hypothetical protein
MPGVLVHLHRLKSDHLALLGLSGWPRSLVTLGRGWLIPSRFLQISSSGYDMDTNFSRLDRSRWNRWDRQKRADRSQGVGPSTQAADVLTG